MRQLLSLLLLLVLATAQAEVYRCTDTNGKVSFQQTPCSVSRTPKSNEPQRDTNQKHMLWHVTLHGNGGIYLVGSLPFGDSTLYPLPKVFDDAYRAADALAIDHQLVSPEDGKLDPDYKRYFYLPGGERLSNLLDQDSRETFDQVAHKYAIERGRIELFRPWYAALEIARAAMRNAGYNENFAIESYLSTKAMNEKPVLSLGKPESLISRYAGLEPMQQQLLLDKTLGDLNTEVPYFDRLTQAWREGRVQNLEAYLIGRLTQVPSLSTLYNKLWEQRNRELVALLDGMLNDKLVYLVVIDASHLLGTEGILNQLKRRGYVVDQL